MKRNSLKKAIAALALTAVAATAMTSALTASAVEGTPVLSLSQISLKWSDIDTDGDGVIDEDMRTQTISLDVEGANMIWSACGIHVNFPTDLAPSLDAFGSITSAWGGAVERMDAKKLLSTTGTDNNGVFVTAAGSAVDGMTFDDGTQMYYGQDGTIATFNVVIPEDAQPGDKWDLTFEYVVTPPADPTTGEATKDLFTNKDYTNAAAAEGLDIDAMTQYATENWVDGFIEIVEDAVTTTTTVTDAPVVETTTTTAAPVVAGTTTAAPAVTTKAATTTKKATTTTKTDSPKTGVSGIAVAAAGLVTAAGAAFVLRKKD